MPCCSASLLASCNASMKALSPCNLCGRPAGVPDSWLSLPCPDLAVAAKGVNQWMESVSSNLSLLLSLSVCHSTFQINQYQPIILKKKVTVESDVLITECPASAVGYSDSLSSYFRWRSPCLPLFLCDMSVTDRLTPTLSLHQAGMPG